MEFILEFFVTLWEDLLSIVEESRVLGKLCGSLNATFISMIPKKDKPIFFHIFRPTSLCNLVYKIISKIIAIKIKPIPSKCFSEEQFVFLQNRHIIDARGVAQEGIHSINIKKIKYLVLKVHIIKAYDRVNCVFLRLVLLQIGLGL